MAAISEQKPNRRGKRKRGDREHRKLCEGQKVEVRNFEEGFLGSWHTGTVVTRRRLMCKVKYAHLLFDNGSDCLVECVPVSSIIDGVKRAEWEPNNYRGVIRPLPPSLDLGKRSLHYGECVDLFYQDAWWEGVIFDHEDGLEYRRIFFPDMGDEMTVCVSKLRITLDWDEVTEEWKPRGNWIFLELVEEVMPELLLLVSVKQIWYEVQEKNVCKDRKEWTFCVRDYWRELVSLVLYDNFKVTITQFLSLLNSAEEFIQEGQSLEFSELALYNNIIKPKEFIDNSLALVPNSVASCMADEAGLLLNNLDVSSIRTIEEKIGPSDFSPKMGEVGNSSKNLHTSIVQSLDEVLSLTPPTQSFLPRTTDKMRKKKLKVQKKLKWYPVSLEAQFCPEAIAEFKRVITLLPRRPTPDIIEKVRKHLLFLGWKVESADDEGMHRFRYSSPSGIVYMSLTQIGKEWETISETLSLVPLLEQRSNDGSTSCSSVVKSQACRELTIIDSEYCLQAVIDYVLIFSQGKRKRATLLADKAKRHLVFSDWKIYSQLKSDKTEIRYMSPKGKVFYSLITACRWYVKENASSPSVAYLTGQRQIRHVDVQDEHVLDEQLLMESAEKLSTLGSSGVPLSKEHVQLGNSGAFGCSRLSKKRKHSFNASRALITVGDVADSHSSTRVLRSSKRVRQVAPCSSHHTPRSVLSWLIDNNVVLPRTKVQYRGREDGHPKREGRITCDGIKCNCCKEIYGLNNFGAHAGSTNHCPSANVFLEDGRSILDCQLEMKRKISARKIEPHIKKWSHNISKSDYICSICHDGGELILCDRCPSSFHIGCLGMKELPDGDWFCPSCCCGMCDQKITDNNALCCCQCDHQYHVACIRTKDCLKHGNYPEGYWLCNKRCEQIFLGLHKLLGKPIQLGTDNLTWTLLKYTKPDSSCQDAPDDEHAMESYSKLNVAIGVMHECFEPVKESRTGSDLMEDIIFSRWSELNRLNFQGFYTVLLERNDELITVANLRVLGGKVAEIPLVATRFQYRRLGMCHILMNVLEKKLAELGVERIVLPAATSVLATWTSSFGFSVMEESDRLKFLDFTILNFHGTVMCQKLLVRTPSTELIVSAEPDLHIFGAVDKGNAELDGSSGVSEVLQAEQIDGSDITDLERTDATGGTGTNNLQPANYVHTVPDFPAQITMDYTAEAPNQKEVENNGVGFKCYKRRRRYQPIEANLLAKVVTDG